MTWMIREDQLDPDQRDFINNESKKTGNIWIRGFAGSGKSVLLVHTLRDTLQRSPNSKVAVVVFTHSLIDLFRTGLKELGLSTDIPIMTYYDFCERRSENYDFIFCDEVQDLPVRVLRSMLSRSGKVFVAGDSNQSIYDKDPKWKESVVKPEMVGQFIKAEPFTLNTIHRLTRSIISAIQKLLPNMNVFGSKRDMTKQDVNIRLCKANNNIEEVNYVYQESLKGASVGDSSVILFPKRDLILSFADSILILNKKPTWQKLTNSFRKHDFNSLNQHFQNNQLKLQFVGSSYGSLRGAEQNKDVILMTYHSAKGLDFDNVFLPYLNKDFPIFPDKASTLFMVAMTRSRKNLYLTYHGETHYLVDTFRDECTEISVSQILNQTRTPKTDVFDF
jgi:superfamily I DNA/RNA helicase